MFRWCADHLRPPAIALGRPGRLRAIAFVAKRSSGVGGVRPLLGRRSDGGPDRRPEKQAIVLRRALSVSTGPSSLREPSLLGVVVRRVGELGQYIGSIAVAAPGQPSQFVEVFPLARQFDELVCCIMVAALGQPSELVEVSPLACQLDELVGGVRAARVGKPSQLGQITLGCGDLDELVDGLPVTVRGASPQVIRFRISHVVLVSIRRVGDSRGQASSGDEVSLPGRGRRSV